MTADRMDPRIFGYLNEGPEVGPADGFDRAIAAVELVDQRPGWTFPQRWLPSPFVGPDGRPSTVARLGILVALMLLTLLALAVAFGGSQPNQLPVGPSGDVFAYQDGDSIAVASRDGSGKRIVSGTVPFARTPVFSPDGTFIAFTAPAAQGSQDGLLMVVPFDGSAPPLNVSQGLILTPSDTNQFSWSGDSTRLVFSARKDGAAQLFIVAAGGGSPEPITDGSVSADLPDWSADGTLIAYRRRNADGLHTDIRQIHPDAGVVDNLGAGDVLRAGIVAADGSISRPLWGPKSLPAYVGTTVLSYALNVGFGSDTAAYLDTGTGPQQPLPDTGVVSNTEQGIPWSPDQSLVAMLTDGGVVVAEFDSGFNAPSHPYKGDAPHLGKVIDCWVAWSPDGQSLYGGSPGSCDHIVVVPLADPSSAQTLPMTITGAAGWRPVSEGSQP